LAGNAIWAFGLTPCRIDLYAAILAGAASRKRPPELNVEIGWKLAV
jgi:hypothetical protein